MARYTAKEIVNNDTDVETKHHEWIPARPENYKFDNLMTRLKHAWYVIIGKYDVLDWQDEKIKK